MTSDATPDTPVDRLVAFRVADPRETLRNAALKADDLHAALFNSVADEGDVIMFHYDCEKGCDVCGTHVEAWCEPCDGPLIETQWWKEYEDGPTWFCGCHRSKVFALAIATLEGSLRSQASGKSDGAS